ncbi:DUF3558 family protein [Actinoplanes solisilvae]|uniref:DUF3558 family protein n=1 Tax=Actinoplanes solisilvae TaxID=2486853 RepID=UPI0013E2D45F|nr:DUF3558 family protein [Actinoplanes solisilvae]
MKRSVGVVAAGLVLLAGAGCGLAGPAASGAPEVAATGQARSGFGSVRESGAIPDPCTLLSRDEVTALTGRAITRIDEDGVADGESTRYCQWQQPGGQLDVFLSRTTAEDFKVVTAQGESVGEDAFWCSGHLYVLYGTVQIDVYTRGGDDLADAKKIAERLLPRV